MNLDQDRYVYESELFEQWIVTRKLFTKYGATLKKKPDGQYADVRVNGHWSTWLARAKIEI